MLYLCSKHVPHSVDAHGRVPIGKLHAAGADHGGDCDAVGLWHSGCADGNCVAGIGAAEWGESHSTLSAM